VRGSFEIHVSEAWKGAARQRRLADLTRPDDEHCGELAPQTA
jgi:hypothetical protein